MVNSTAFDTSVTTSRQDDGNQDREFGPEYRVLFSMLVFQSVITCVGNVLTVIVVFKDPALRTLANMHIVSLACSDFIAGLTGSYGSIWFTNAHVDRFLYTCKFCCVLWYILFLISFTASLFSMSLIAVDRWVYIAYPLRYYIWITPFKTACMIGLAWTAAVFFGFLSTNANTYVSIAECTTVLIVKRGYLTYGVGAILFGSCTISFVFYFKILLIAKKHNNSVHVQNSGQNFTRNTYRQIKILFLICFISFGCWIPFYIENLPGVPPFSYEVSNFIMSLSLFNSFINVFIYSAKNSTFRRSFLKLFRCIK